MRPRQTVAARFCTRNISNRGDDMDANQHSFNMESYKQIRSEVSVLLTRIENLFRYSLLVSASIFAWLLTKSFGLNGLAQPCINLPREALSIAWSIPPAFVLLCGGIALATHIRIVQMSGFLEKCELALGVPELSWEVYFRSKWPLFTIVTAIAWIVMLLAVCYATYVGSCLSRSDYCPLPGKAGQSQGISPAADNAPGAESRTPALQPSPAARGAAGDAVVAGSRS